MNLIQQLKIVPIGCVGWHGLAMRRAIAAQSRVLNDRLLRGYRGGIAKRHGVIVAPSARSLLLSTSFYQQLFVVYTDGGREGAASHVEPIAVGTEATGTIASLLERCGKYGAALSLRAAHPGSGRPLVVLLAADGGVLRVFWVLSRPPMTVWSDE
ncbi:MAG: hypothetical protein ACHREM_13780 [Polyangiales bacterium]